MIGECHKFDRAGHPSSRGRVSRAHPRSGFISSTGGQCMEGGAEAVGGGRQEAVAKGPTKLSQVELG